MELGACDFGIGERSRLSGTGAEAAALASPPWALCGLVVYPLSCSKD
jgi:hypothetical protein